MNRLLLVVLTLAVTSVSAQTICTPIIGGEYNCYDYGAASPIVITPRFDPYVTPPEARPGPPSANRPEVFRGLPRGRYDTYNYQTGESGIITLRPDGRFTIDKY